MIYTISFAVVCKKSRYNSKHPADLGELMRLSQNETAADR